MRGRPRVVLAGLSLMVGAAAGILAPPPATAAPPACWAGLGTDVTGGGPDLVIGLPSYDLPDKPDAGAIVVFSNVADATTEATPYPAPHAPTAASLYTADHIPGLTAQSGARFGASVQVTRSLDIHDDGDSCANLLIGSPGQTVAGRSGAGQVALLDGDPGALSLVRVYDETGLAGGAQAGAKFGTAIAEDGGILLIAAPGRDIGSAADAGRVGLFDYQAPGPLVTSVIQQGASGAGAPETGDRFGEVLHIEGGSPAILLFGVPHEDVGSQVDAGAVASMPYGGSLTMVTQNSPGAGGVAESGDRYGSSLATSFSAFEMRVLIGVPGEDVGSTSNAGAVALANVHLFDTPSTHGPITGLGWTTTQASPGVPGAVEAGDAFGSTLLVENFRKFNGTPHLLVGAPLENLGTVVDAGLVTLTPLNEDGSFNDDLDPAAWDQGSPAVSGTPERGDRFGSVASAVVISAAPEDDDPLPYALVTVPGEDIGTVKDAGLAYLGVPPGKGSIALTLPVRQAGAGLGMVPMTS